MFRLPVTITFCLAILSCNTVFAFQQDNAEAEKISRYLEELGLEELLIEHLEQQFSGDLDSASRKTIALRLSDLYTERLMGNEPDTSQLERWLSRASSLFDRSPGLDAPALRVAIFHARYQDVSKAFQSWWFAGSPPEQRAEIVDQWRLLIRDLLQFNRTINNRRNDLVTAFETGLRENDALRIEVLETENIFLQSAYLLGWSCYFRSVADFENEQQWQELSEEHFRSFLQLTAEKPLDELTVDWFDFESPWTARAVVGLAMVAGATGRQQAGEQLFEVALMSGDRGILTSIESWRLTSAAYNNNFEAAAVIAESYQPTGDQSADYAFRILCVRTGNALFENADAVADRIFRSGILDLIRLRNVDVLNEVLADINPAMLARSGEFYMNWANGLIESGRAQDAGMDADLEQARLTLERAVSAAGAGSDPDDVARCQYALGWIYYREREFDEAAGLFESVASQLRDSDRDLATEALWFQIQALIQVSRDNPRKTARTFAAMDRMLNWFPETGYARQVEFEKTLLEVRGLPPGEAMRQLQSVEPRPENYHRVVYEMAGIQYEMWLRSYRTGSATTLALLDRLEQLEAVHRNLPESPDQRKLKILLLVVDALLKTPERQPEAGRLLQAAAELADPLATNVNATGSYIEYRYYKFIYDQKRGGVDLDQDAQWLVENARGTSFENTALVYQAQRADAMIDNRRLYNSVLDGEEIDQEMIQRAITIYNRLAELSGTSEEKLRASSNSRFITFRLAELYYFSGRWNLAAGLNRTLRAIRPLEQNYLIQAARIQMKTGDLVEANRSWQTIVNGVEPGSEPWFEGRYQMVNCLAEESSERALSLYRRTVRLSPDMPDHWRDRFDRLGATLEQ